MKTCSKCGAPCPDDHDICWCCEYDKKLPILDNNLNDITPRKEQEETFECETCKI